MQYDSWEITNENVAIKKCDKSVFEYKGSVIPVETRSFWGIEDLKPKEKTEIKLKYDKNDYDAYISKHESINTTRIFWHTDLHNQILDKFPDHEEFSDDFPLFKFTKIANDYYEIDFSYKYTDKSNHSEVTYEVYEHIEGKKEGKQKLYYSTKYERDPRNRSEAIRFHGLKCKICSFDFSKIYGELGKGFIEIHHLKPLASLDEEVIVDPQKDLVPVCANCHRMIHRSRYKTYSLQEISDMISKNKN